MQAEEHVLRDLLRQIAVAQEVIGHTEHHRAMLADEVAEITPALYRGLESDHLASVAYVTLLVTLVLRKSLFTIFTEIVRL